MVRLLIWTMIVGCGPTAIVADAGPSPDAGGPTGLLTIESAPSLTLAFGDPAEIVVRYTEDGAPVEGVTVRFGLEGRAHDSTVQDLERTTQSDGRVTTALLAGSERTVFRVRVSADRAAPAYVDVAVGDMGFGTLVVGAVYAGRRESVAQRVVRIYAETDCAPLEMLPALPDREIILDDEMEVEGSAVLAAGLRYAVVGRVEGTGGGTLATACMDGVMIQPDMERRVDLVFEDAPLILEGDYAMELELAPSDTRAMAAALTATAAKARIELAGSGASLYLDALEDELAARGDGATADALAVERVTGMPDDSLEARLDAASVGPSNAIRLLVMRLDARFGRVAVSGPFAITASSGTWSAAEISIGAIGDPDSPPLALDATEIRAPITTNIALEWREAEDTVAVAPLSMSLPVGALVDATLAAEARAMALADASDLLLEGAGCEVLAAWIAESPTLATCDADCAQAACARALDSLLESITAATMAADEARHMIEVSGDVSAADHDGDLLVDALLGEMLAGRWTGSLGDGGDPLTGALRATRVIE